MEALGAGAVKDKSFAVASGCFRGVHELATLFRSRKTLVRNGKPQVGQGSSTHTTSAEGSLPLPAHRRLPHKAFLSGLWWKLLLLQPLQLNWLSTCQYSAVSAQLRKLGAGSCTWAVFVPAIPSGSKSDHRTTGCHTEAADWERQLASTVPHT